MLRSEFGYPPRGLVGNLNHSSRRWTVYPPEGREDPRSWGVAQCPKNPPLESDSSNLRLTGLHPFFCFDTPPGNRAAPHALPCPEPTADLLCGQSLGSFGWSVQEGLGSCTMGRRTPSRPTSLRAAWQVWETLPGWRDREVRFPDRTKSTVSVKGLALRVRVRVGFMPHAPCSGLGLAVARRAHHRHIVG